MAIKIIDSPEPLSEASLTDRGATSTPLLVESSASRVLQQELRRYCLGLINGRSFLIAGHRGAGKTTLVAKALMDVRQASGASMLRPLFIPLHGPSLFPDPAMQALAAKQETAAVLAAQGSRPPDVKPPEPGRPDGKPSVPPRKSDAQIALEQITLGLHRAVAKEFATQYRQRVDHLARLRRTPNESRHWLENARAGRSLATDQMLYDQLPDEVALRSLVNQLPNDRELFELAGQPDAELYEGPTPERLRAFWEHAHALSGGVLFTNGFAPLMSGIVGNPTPSLPPGMFPNLVAVHGQGVRELVALSGIVEAYRRISGDYKRSEGEKSLRSQTSERTTGFDATKELAAPIASLITGGLAGTGLAISGATTATTALGGIISALGASLVFKATSTRKRERSTSREYQFIHDLSVATLDRILPILIDRVRNAGLAPVFVVDELDKVKELSTRLVGMVHHLKKLVAENAFFCFLTNRSYFEEMLAKGSGRPYPVEYTYYTERLFVVFSPEDFERYLRQRIPEPVVQQPAEPVTTVPAGPSNVEAAAADQLRWTLRHRSQLHAVDLQREIAALRDDDGVVRTKPEVIIALRRNRIDLTFQVGIELTLAQDDVEQVLLDRPEFRRLVHDTMYFISRQWLSGEEEIDLSPTGLPAFMAYLEHRTGREEEWPDGKPPQEKPRESVSLKDADFLFELLQVLADFLSDRATLDGTGRDWRRERLDAWSDARKKRELPALEGEIQNALLTGEQASLLQRQEHTGVYRFRYRVAGKSWQPPAHPEPARTLDPTERPASEGPATTPHESGTATEAPATTAPAWKVQAEFIEEFASAVYWAARHTADSTGSNPAEAARRIGAVTLETLATAFRILPLSPTSAIALKAIANLRDAEARGALTKSNDEDAFQVDQFYRILERNGRQIARAIVLGAVVGRGKDGPSEERIASGLTVLSRALQFANKREGDVVSALENVSAMVNNHYDMDVEAELAAIPNLVSSVKPFADVTRKLVGNAFALAPDVPALEARAWDDAQNRMLHWVRTSDMLDPTLQEILAAAGGQGPTLLLEFDASQMTLHQWTRVLLEARRTVPWLTLICWHALGFRTKDVNELRVFVRWADLPDYFTSATASPAGWDHRLIRVHAAVHEGYLLRQRMAANSTLIVLRRGNSPLTAGWRPRADGATLVVTGRELNEIVTPITTPSIAFELPSTPENVCAVEMDPETPLELNAVQLPAIKQLLRGSARLISVYPSDYTREMRPPLISAPSDPASVVKAAQQSSQTI